jgi:hypothetical protein
LVVPKMSQECTTGVNHCSCKQRQINLFIKEDEKEKRHGGALPLD